MRLESGESLDTDRVGMDIAHCGSQNDLTLCGSSQFTIWRQLWVQTSKCVLKQLDALFNERGEPVELLISIPLFVEICSLSSREGSACL